MQESELNRLFGLYKSGTVSDTGSNTDLLQVAKAVGNDLTLDEFSAIASKIESINASTDKPADKKSKIWDLPTTVSVSRQFWKPVRDQDNVPTNFDEIEEKTHEEPVVHSEGRSVLGLADIPDSEEENPERDPTDQPSKSILRDHLEDIDSYEPEHVRDVMQSGLVADGSNAPLVDDRGNHFNPNVEPKESPTQPPSNSEESSKNPSAYKSTLDSLQTAGDVAGVADQSGITDLTNAGVSLFRAVTEPEDAMKHLGNAAISTVSAIPVVGDLAKLLKLGGKGAKAAKAGRAAGRVESAAEASAKANSGVESAINRLFGGGNPVDIPGLATGGGMGGGGRLPPGSRFAGGDDPDDGDGSDSSGSDSSQSFFGNLLATFGGTAGGGQYSRSGRAGFGGHGSFGVGGSAFQPYGASSSPDDDGTTRKLENLSDAFESLIRKIPVVGDTLGGMVGRLNEFNKWIRAADTEGRRLVETHRELAQYSGELSLAYSRYDLESHKRKIGNARYLGGAISDLTSAQSGLENSQNEANKPYMRTFLNVATYLSSIANVATKVQSYTSVTQNILRLIYAAVDKNRPTEKERNPFEAAANEFFDPKNPVPMKLPAKGVF